MFIWWKIKELINKICIKTGFIKENCEFIINRKAKKNLTVEENGIFVESDFICVIKKSQKEINKKPEKIILIIIIMNYQKVILIYKY